MTALDILDELQAPEYGKAYDVYYNAAYDSLSDRGHRYALELAVQEHRTAALVGSASLSDKESFNSLVKAIHDIDPVTASRVYARVYIEHPELNPDVLVAGGFKGWISKNVIGRTIRRVTGRGADDAARAAARRAAEQKAQQATAKKAQQAAAKKAQQQAAARASKQAQQEAAARASKKAQQEAAARASKQAQQEAAARAARNKTNSTAYSPAGSRPPIGVAANKAPTPVRSVVPNEVNPIHQVHAMSDDAVRDVARRFAGSQTAPGAAVRAADDVVGTFDNLAGKADDAFPNAAESQGFLNQLNQKGFLKKGLGLTAFTLGVSTVPMFGMYLMDLPGREAGIQVESEQKRLEEQAAVIEQSYLDWGLPPEIAAEYAKRYVDNGGIEDGAINLGCSGPLAGYFTGCDQGATTDTGGGGSVAIDTGGGYGGGYPVDTGGGYPVDTGGQTATGETLFDQGYKEGDFVQDGSGNIYVVDSTGMPVTVSNDQLQDLIGDDTGGGTQTTVPTGTGTGTQIGTTQNIAPIYIPSTYGYSQGTGTGTSAGSSFGQYPYNSQLNSYYDLFGGSSTGTSTNQYY